VFVHMRMRPVCQTWSKHSGAYFMIEEWCMQ